MVNRRLLLIIGFIPLCLCLLAAGAVVVLYQFSSEPPGEGLQAQRGYDACEPVIAALEQYYADHEDYRAALDELSPAYLEEIPQEANGFPIEYERTAESYTLEFSYLGPGMNRCTYTPEAGWDCYAVN